jgi:two-component system, cell cycle sensor histidine kinase and response regulator CckA
MVETLCMNDIPSWNINAATSLHATILVADDDPGVRQMIGKILRRSGFSVIEAESGDRAVAAAAACQGIVDLVIIDMQMPGMNGLDLASEVARRYPAMKVLYISGNQDSIALDCIARHSPESVLFKPFSVETLLQRVRRLLDRDI